jgi:hypothetical protein
MQSTACIEAGAGGWGGFAHALTWTLVHSLWIGASLAALLYGFLRLVPARRARLRYGASLVALFGVPLAAAWTLGLELARDCGAPFFLPEEAGADAAAASTLIGPLVDAANGLRAVLAERLAPAEPWIAAGWTLVAALALVRLAGGWVWLLQFAERDLVRASPRMQARLARLARRLGLRRGPGLYWSRRADVPMVVGALSPRVVLPARLTGAALRGELDLVLLHELGHVRRRDGAVHGAEALLGALFLFHPFWRWIQARVGREREHCCDDLALEGGADRVAYLRSLARLEEARVARAPRAARVREPAALAAASLYATDGELLERVRRLTCAAPELCGPALARACGGILLGAAGLAFGAVPTRDAPTTWVSLAFVGSATQGEFDLESTGTWVEGTPLDADFAPTRAHVVREFVIATERPDPASEPHEPLLIRIVDESAVSQGEFVVARPARFVGAAPHAARGTVRIRRVNSRR